MLTPTTHDVKFYRVKPADRLQYLKPLTDGPVTGLYQQGAAKTPFAGVLTLAYDPIRRVHVAVITPPDGNTLALNVSSLYHITAAA